MQNNKLNLLERAFQKGSKSEISGIITDFRNGPPVKGLISLLVDIYDKSVDHEIRGLINGFMNDLKNQEFTSEVMSGVKNCTSPDTRLMLISSAWQSGLDYSDYTEDIITLFLDGPLDLSIECYSVMNECITIDNEMKRAALADKIEAFIEGFEPPKRALSTDMIRVLRTGGFSGTIPPS